MGSSDNTVPERSLFAGDSPHTPSPPPSHKQALASTNQPSNGADNFDHNSDKIIDTPAMHRATMRKYQINGKWYQPTTTQIGKNYIGIASWYGPNFHGKKTSNGEVYDMHKFTSAHKTLPMNTMVKVTNLSNQKEITVRINDRGPFVKDRIIDLSYAAAKALDVYDHGTTEVQLEILGFSHLGTQANDRIITIENIGLQIGAFSQADNAHAILQRYTSDRYMAKVHSHHTPCNTTKYL